MKKLIIAVLLILVLFSTSFLSSSAVEPEEEYEYDYEELAALSEYDRIYKDSQDKWHGVITIAELNVFNTRSQLSTTLISKYDYYIEFSFFRETQYLKSITLSYSHESYCLLITCAFGGSVAADTVFQTYNYDPNAVDLSDAKSITEAFGNGSITASADPNYDYVVDIGLNATQDVDVMVEVFEFTYVLTDLEILDLRLDIQSQYEEELAIIMNNTLLTQEEKEAQIALLQAEYADYNVDFGEIMTSDCVGDCTDEYDGTYDEPLENKLLDALSDIGRYLLIALGSGILITAVAYAFIGAAINTAKSATTSFLKQMLDIGIYYGKVLHKGLMYIISMFFAAFGVKL